MSLISRTPRTVLGALVPGVLDPGAATRILCVVRSWEASSLRDPAPRLRPEVTGRLWPVTLVEQRPYTLTPREDRITLRRYSIWPSAPQARKATVTRSSWITRTRTTRRTISPAGPAGELAGRPVLLFAVTLLAIFMLQARGIPGAILIGIVGGTVLAVGLDAFGVVDPKQWASGAPELHGSAVSMPDFSVFGDVEFGGWGEVGAMTVGMIVFTLVLAGFFDAMATIIGVGTEAKLADDKGRMPGLSKALFIDGAGGAIGGVSGASGQTVFVESATGVGEGARTGLSSVVTGFFFAACLFFTPLTAIVPGEVAAAALVVIGAMMMMNARHVDWADRATAIPVFLTVVIMPFTYSITAGVAAGVISCTAVRTAQGKAREIGVLMWGLTLVFVVYFALAPIGSWLGVH